MQKTALMVIDMQNAFCRETGSVVRLTGPLANIEEVVSRTSVAVGQARADDLPVIFTRHCYRPGYIDSPRLGREIDRMVREGNGLRSGTEDSSVIAELGLQEGDLVIDKCRPDAFFETSLHTVLRGLEVDHLVLSGVVTNVCVESTARGAHMRDFAVTVLADCCTSRSHEDHLAALDLLERYGFVSLACLGQGYRIGKTEAQIQGVHSA